VGECWLAWTVERGYQLGIGNLYQYAVVDLISGVACARLYTKKNADCALDLLLGVAIPMGNELLMQPSWIMTPHQVEYTTGRIHSRHLYTSKLREMNIKQVIWEQKNNLYSKTVQVFNQKSGVYLESLLESADSFDAIKDGFQQFVREYNLELPLGYGKNTQNANGNRCRPQGPRGDPALMVLCQSEVLMVQKDMWFVAAFRTAGQPG